MNTKLTGEILDTLVECLEFLDNYVDVVDGDYGEPAPNRAMSLSSRVEDCIAALEKDGR
jgi:hypothetical protein